MMNSSRRKLERLLRLARQAPAEITAPVESGFPPWFAQRVAARWASGRAARPGIELWERAAAWGLGAAVLLCLGTALVGEMVQPAPTGLDAMLVGSFPEADSIL